MVAPFLAVLLLAGARSLWPATLPPATENFIFNLAVASLALAWQVYAVWVHRQALGPWMTLLVVLLPMGGANSPYVWENWRVLTYAAITGVLIGGAFLWRHRSD